MARERKFTKQDLYQVTKELLLQAGYEGFNFTSLAANLQVSRSAIYKYFKNKDHLISNYMVYETEKFVESLATIDKITEFEQQLDFLLRCILDDKESQRIREMAIKLPEINSKFSEENKQRLAELHREMYTCLQNFINKGKEDNHFHPHIPNSLILGFIFNTIDLPNHENISTEQWIGHIKDILRHGIVTNI